MRRQLTAGCAVLALLAGCTRHEGAKAPSGPPDAAGGAEGAGGAEEAPPTPREEAEAAGRLVHGFIDRLSHDDPAVRGEAAVALAKIGPPAAPELVAQLLARLNQPGEPGRDPAFRRKAASLLGGMASSNPSRDEGAGAGLTVPALVAAMRDGDPLVREAAARSLARTGREGVTALARALAEPRREVKNAAAEALGYAGEAALPAVPDMVRAARDFNLRGRIARSIRRLGPDAVAAVVRALKEQPSIYTVYLLEEIGRGAVSCPGARAWDTALPALVELLSDPRARVRDGVVSVLGEMGPAAGRAAPALASLMREAEPGGQLRVRVARALARVDPGNGEALAILLDQAAGLVKRTVGVHDPGRVRGLLDDVTSLAELGPAARDAVPALIELLRDRSVNTRIVAADAILKIDPRSTAPLQTLTRELGGRLGLQAARLLGKMGPAAKDAVPKLIRMLEATPRGGGKGTASVRPVVEALGGIGSAAVPALVEALGHERPGVRAGAVMALGRIGPGAKDSLGALQGLAAGRGGDAKLGPLARAAMARITRRLPGVVKRTVGVRGLWERAARGADRKVFVEGLRRAMVCPPDRAAGRARELDALAEEIGVGPPHRRSRRLVELAAVNVRFTRTPPSEMDERLYGKIRWKLDALKSRMSHGRRKVVHDANAVYTELVVLDHRFACPGDREELHGLARKLAGSLDEVVSFGEDLWPDLRGLILSRALLIVLRQIEARLTAELGLSPEERRLPAAREYVAVLEEVGAPWEIVAREKRKLERAAAGGTRGP